MPENEIFTGLYDQVFIHDIKNIYDGGKISDLTKRFLEGNASKVEKKYFLQLKKQYFKVKKIKNYSSIQKKLYNNKSRRDIVLFEIARIKKNGKMSSEFEDTICDIEELLTIQYKEIPDDVYMKVVKSIIKVEMSLEMKIGLFDELCSLFEKELEKVNSDMLIDNEVKLSRRK